MQLQGQFRMEEPGSGKIWPCESREGVGAASGGVAEGGG